MGLELHHCRATDDRCEGEEKKKDFISENGSRLLDENQTVDADR